MAARVHWSRFATILVVIGLVLSPLRAMAATIRLLSAPVAAAATTIPIGASASVLHEANGARSSAYDAAFVGYDGASDRRVAAGEIAARVYDGDLEHAASRPLRAQVAIYDPPANVAEGVEAAVAQGAKTAASRAPSTAFGKSIEALQQSRTTGAGPWKLFTAHAEGSVSKTYNDGNRRFIGVSSARCRGKRAVLGSRRLRRPCARVGI